ncbi:MAG: hypothetical protein QOJ79_1427 [Actinomycetota bacterium]|jgi:exopolysaccharide biosynthesis polyprenyl glycosylphosphotransferase|nr:hypothetical protein [Actinomycetota bacterium]
MTAQVQERPLELVRTDVLDVPAASSAGWLQRYARTLVLVDAAALTAAAAAGLLLRFGTRSGELHGIPYVSVAAAGVLIWLAVLALGRCYETRFLGGGTEEFRRVGNASVRLGAAVAVLGYTTRIDLARGFVAITLPAGLVLLLLGRYAARLWLHRARRRGRCSHRVLVVGSSAQADDLVNQLRRDPLAGLEVVGVCLPGGAALAEMRTAGAVPIVGTLSSVVPALAVVQADTVAVASSPAISREALRRLSYELEGTGVDLLVAPALTNVSGTRLSIRPVAGLPLLHLDEPELTGARKLLKSGFDRGVAAVALVVLLPVLLGVAISIRTTSRGPAIFRQQRVGRDGEVFFVWKFRSMITDAERFKEQLGGRNDMTTGVLFKLRSDPRVTGVGRWLRKYSLDELPQLVNVVRGEMSLVGPRPPLAAEVAQYEHHTRRRLLVKPGMTGLWQVSGRSDLSWEETVRLDLQYVENWSLGLDLVILAKTLTAVLRSNGAY